MITAAFALDDIAGEVAIVTGGAAARRLNQPRGTAEPEAERGAP